MEIIISSMSRMITLVIWCEFFSNSKWSRCDFITRNM